MCELLVRVNDKVNKEDFYKNCQCTKRGDVIVIQPDGWAWGKEELANPDWCIIKIPGIDPDTYSAFLRPEPPVDPANPSPTLQRRAFKIDLDNPSVPAAVKTAVADGAEVSVTPQTFDPLALKIAKPAIADPALIGSDKLVIG